MSLSRSRASGGRPSHEDWLANHLVDYSIISSIYQYINSLLELGDHTAIRQKLIYFIHNVFPASIKPLLISSSGEWISYSNINMNVQHKAHMAIKFVASTTTDSDVQDEEPSTKSIKSIKPSDSSDTIQQGTIIKFNKGSTVTVNINQETISNKPNYKQLDIKDSRITSSNTSPAS
eukprot:5993157-Amphidinium_carterae.1